MKNRSNVTILLIYYINLIILINYLLQFIRLFFPKNCEACGKSLLKKEDFLCTQCLYDIPRTKFHEKEDNILNRLFYGITKIKYSTAFYFFKKGSKFRVLIHKLKYNKQKELGIEMGKMLGNEIKGSFFEETDIIIPVPLHPAKQRKRGYNQSEIISEGLSVSFKKDYRKDILTRAVYTETQTKKTLEERRENVKSAFKVVYPEEIKGKHILLIDDVVTTGSTLASCANELLKIAGVTVSVAVLGYADH